MKQFINKIGISLFELNINFGNIQLFSSEDCICNKLKAEIIRYINYWILFMKNNYYYYKIEMPLINTNDKYLILIYSRYKI